jgi:hydrogenase maturation protease
VTGEKPCCSTGKQPDMLILGIGNILLQDEGVGVRVVEALQALQMPGNVELLDGGTASQDIVHALSGHRTLIVVDAVQADQKPGTILRFKPDDLDLNHAVPLSVHQMHFLDALRMAELTPQGSPQQVVIYGIQPGSIGWGLELSTAVAAAVPRVIELILTDIETFNAPMFLREASYHEQLS